MLDLLLLKSSDIKNLISYDDAAKVIKNAFDKKGKNLLQMPPKPYLHFKKFNGDLRIMPAYFEGSDFAIVKLVNSHPLNPIKGFPSVIASILVFDASTGSPVCLMDGIFITSLRTAITTAIATEFLKPKNSQVLGIVGVGAQCMPHIEILNSLQSFKQTYVSSISIEESQNFLEMNKHSLRNVSISALSIEECVSFSDVLITLTPVKHPIIQKKWLKKDVHINAIGADAPGKQELDNDIILNSKIIVDDMQQSLHGGEINVPINTGIIKSDFIHGELSDLIAGKLEGRSNSQLTIFDSTGLALQDAAISELVYKKALSQNYDNFIHY
jgi:alanine dehydrogenase